MTEELEVARFEGEGGPPLREREHYHAVLGPVVERSVIVIRVRRATSRDIAACVRMAVRFIAESSYRGLVLPNVGQLRKLAEVLLDHGAVFVAQVDGGDDVVGMLGVSLIPHVMSGELVASEAVWWVEPEHRLSSAGGRLLVAAEWWALKQGAVWLQMIAPAGNERLRAFYRRRGYVEVETVFQRRLAA